MRGLPVLGLLLLELLKVCVCIQVFVQQQEVRTALFANVILRCDFSTSANLQEVLVTWKYKSFCKDPILEYYTTAYQSALQLGQDPANDCQDRQRTVRTVLQRKGNGEPTLGVEYRERKISVQNKADLVINEVMWWDNGVYFCTVQAPGDTTGDSDKEIRLIVFHWLTVLGIILGFLLLFLLIFICCCQCCPQICCCYLRCPCCPQTCCCPERLVMQHRMMKEAQRAMMPWSAGQPVYAPMTASSQMNPLLYPGSVSGKDVPLKPMPLPPPQSTAYSMPPPSVGYVPPSSNSQMLDYLESQVKGMDLSSPLMQPAPPPHLQQAPPHLQQAPPPGQHLPLSVPFSPGPPSMISALNDGPAERRIITLPAIREQRGAPPPPKTRPPSSSESSRSGFSRRDPRGGSGGRRPPSPSRSQALSRSYSQDSLDGGGRRGGPGPRRSRSRDDLFDSRSRATYSRRGSWSSDDDVSSRRGGPRRGGGSYGENPPSYTEYEPGQKPGGRRHQRYSDRSGTSVVI